MIQAIQIVLNAQHMMKLYVLNVELVTTLMKIKPVKLVQVTVLIAYRNIIAQLVLMAIL